MPLSRNERIALAAIVGAGTYFGIDHAASHCTTDGARTALEVMAPVGTALWLEYNIGRIVDGAGSGAVALRNSLRMANAAFFGYLAGTNLVDGVMHNGNFSARGSPHNPLDQIVTGLQRVYYGLNMALEGIDTGVRDFVRRFDGTVGAASALLAERAYRTVRYLTK